MFFFFFLCFEPETSLKYIFKLCVNYRISETDHERDYPRKIEGDSVRRIERDRENQQKHRKIIDFSLKLL